MLIPRNISLRRQQVASTSIRSADAKAGYAGCMASARQIEVEVSGSDESSLLEERDPRAPLPARHCAPRPAPRAPRAPRAQHPAAALGSWRRESRWERAGPPRQRSIARAENATRARRTAASAPGLCGDSPASARRRESRSKRALGLCSAALSPAPRKRQQACRASGGFWAPATVRRRRTASVISRVFPVIR